MKRNALFVGAVTELFCFMTINVAAQDYKTLGARMMNVNEG